MGHVPATIGKCRMCGIGIMVNYIGKDGILCAKCKLIVKDLKMNLKKDTSKTQHILIPTDQIVIIVQDTMPICEGGFFPGQRFGGFDSEEMFKHCAFTENTIVRIEGRNYIVNTVENKDGEFRQVPIPVRKK